MSWTYRQWINRAFSEIGLANYVFDLQPQDLQTALETLIAMLADWNGKGIRLGVPLPDSPNTADLDIVSGAPDRANSAIYLNLAIQLAPSYGKTALPATVTAAARAYNTLLSQSINVQPMQYIASTPLGAGNKTWRWMGQSPFVTRPRNPIDGGPDGPINMG